ncbi:unnamed protein product, partial [Symbiodinium sp. KB8]
MGPWGACCYSDAPPGVITSTLHDIADMLKIAANHRTRRKNLVKTSRMKFLPRSQESVERLHASIIGRSLGRSFANVLLLTRVLMAFKEALHHSCIEAVLKHRTGRLRAEVAAPDLAAAERSFRAWRSVTMLCQSHRAMESEIVRGRAALVNVWSKGREDLGRAVDRLSARLLVETLELSFLSWRDAVRLSNLESYANHLCSQRQRTPAVLQRVALLADEAFLLPRSYAAMQESFMRRCLAWFAGPARVRCFAKASPWGASLVSFGVPAGRLHKDTETRLAEALCSAASLPEPQRRRSIQLQREGANKLRLQSAALGYMRRSVQVERRWLQQAALRGWLRVSKAARASRRAASRAAIREQRRRCGDVWQAWRSWLHSSRRRHYSHVQGQRVVSRTVQSEILTCWHGWQEVLTKRKAEDKSARLRSLRWNTSDQRLARAKHQLLRDCLAGWAKECREASMRKARKRQAETQCLAMAAANGIIVMLRGDPALEVSVLGLGVQCALPCSALDHIVSKLTYGIMVCLGKTSLRSLEYARKVQAALTEERRGGNEGVHVDQGWDDFDDQEELDLSEVQPASDLASGVDVALQTLDAGSTSADTESLDSQFQREAAEIAPPSVADAREDDFDRSGELSSKPAQPVASAPKQSVASLVNPDDVPAEDDPELANLERSVLQLVNQGAMPGMVAFIEEVRTILDNKMRKELYEQHNATTRALAAQYEAVLKCFVEDVESYKNASTAACFSENFSRYSPDGFRLPALANEHRNCRQIQAKVRVYWEDMEELAKDAKARMEVLCAYYAGNETSRTFPVGTSRDCLFNTDRYPAVSGTRYIDFLKDQLAWWDKEYMKIRESREQCERAKQDVAEYERNAAEAKNAFDQTLTFCAKSQDTLDEASCSYKAAVKEDGNWTIYNRTLQQAKVEETFLKAQMRAVMRIHCYLGVFELKDVAAGIETCKGKDFRNHTNVTSMEFTVQPKPHVPACRYDLADIAGYCVYEGVDMRSFTFAEGSAKLPRLQSFGSWRQFVEEGKAAQTLEQAQASKSSAVDQALQQAMMALERCQEQPGPFHCQLLSAWWGLILQRKSRERQKQQAMQMALARENSAEDSLVACCFSGWRRAQEAWCRQRAQEEAVADARAMTHLKTLDALRRRADAEGETLLLFHFLAWLRSLLHCKVEKARKEKAMTSAFGQLMLDDEMMRSRCFSEWRQAVHDSHREAVKAAMEREAEDRMREAQEQKLQVMRQAFRSSDEALLGSVVLAWHHTSRTAKRRSAAHTAGEALHTRQQAERSSFFVARAVAAWHLAASRAVAARGARARRRSAVGEVLDTWLCRALQRGVDSAELRSFQVLLLDSWQQAATTLRRAKSRLPGSRARADQIGKELRLGLVCHTWGAWRRLGAAAPKRRGWLTAGPSKIGMAQHDALQEECVDAEVPDEPENLHSNPQLLPISREQRLSVASAELPLPYRMSFPDTNSSRVSKRGTLDTDTTNMSKRRSQDTDGSKEVRRSVEIPSGGSGEAKMSSIKRFHQRSDSRLTRHLSRRYSAVDQEIVRGISLARTLRGCGSIWRYNPSRLSPEDRMAIYNQSIEADHFDVFYSHTWFTAGRWKVLTLMLQFGWQTVLLIWGLAVALATILRQTDVLPAPLSFQPDIVDFSDECPLGPWCLLCSFGASLIGLVIAPYGAGLYKDELCFLDVASIHQTDTDLMERGVYGIGGFLRISHELRILWSPPYLSRLWCVFELAAYRKVNPDGKITFAPLFVERTCRIIEEVLCVYLANFCILAASASSDSQFLARFGEFIHEAITKWYGNKDSELSEEAFAAFIQGPLRQELQAAIGVSIDFLLALVNAGASGESLLSYVMGILVGVNMIWVPACLVVMINLSDHFAPKLAGAMDHLQTAGIVVLVLVVVDAGRLLAGFATWASTRVSERAQRTPGTSGLAKTVSAIFRESLRFDDEGQVGNEQGMSENGGHARPAFGAPASFLQWPSRLELLGPELACNDFLAVVKHVDVQSRFEMQQAGALIVQRRRGGEKTRQPQEEDAEEDEPTEAEAEAEHAEDVSELLPLQLDKLPMYTSEKAEIGGESSASSTLPYQGRFAGDVALSSSPERLPPGPDLGTGQDVLDEDIPDVSFHCVILNGRWKAKSLHEDLRRWALEGWHIFAVSARGERRVATACARARELQVGARRQKLVLVDFASTQCQLAALCILLLRWALVARSYRLSSRLKEWGHVAASRHAARQEAQLLHICLAAFAAEVSEARRGRIYTDMTCQIHAAVANCDQFFQRLVLKRCQAGRVVSRLQSAAQLRHLRSTFAAWSCVLYRRRRLRESMAKLSTHLEAAAAAELMAVALAGWSWKAKEEKATRRGVRSLARGSKVILRLRRQLLLLEAFRGWQHARCYEEVFQMLTASQADLANAAEAVALAEAAAAAAARSQQVTVRVLPT